MAAAERGDPPPGWEVFSEEREGEVRWGVRRVRGNVRYRAAAWGLASREAAVRWAWRLAEAHRRPRVTRSSDASPTTPRAPRVRPWWAEKD